MSRELPISHLRKAHGAEITVRLKNGSEIRGKLLVYDEMMNLVLDSARELDPDTKEVRRSMGTLFIRGNNVLFITLE
ncbi:MAG: U6 snRNA-associated Sm-like protein LSm6 [Candidatus Korarchaeota archaeon]|nr:U6 snRNA-associated Sm-like protein LSm6 [Candidatus Korarchaeota archaeon]MDK2384409.1 U6 snRNA-associated Sm-like protein LSm6 [Candidatus Korarchaeota archaeon]